MKRGGRGGRGRGGARRFTSSSSERIVSVADESDMTLHQRFSALQKSGGTKRKADELASSSSKRGGKAQKRGGRGGKGNASQSQRNPKVKKQEVSQEDLDRELDEMMGRDHSKAVKENLDQELEEYHQAGAEQEEEEEAE
jgi:hypothetical protein